jgi:hypothetical protein
MDRKNVRLGVFPQFCLTFLQNHSLNEKKFLPADGTPEVERAVEISQQSDEH